MGKTTIDEFVKRQELKHIVDSTITSVATDIQNKDTLPGQTADTVMALAMLVMARATLT